MNTSQPTPHLQSSCSQEILTDARRYWELRRIPYNAVLTMVVLAWIVLSWPHFRPAFNWPDLFALLVLATLANVCYCGAYLVDVPIQYSAFRNAWLRRRWLLWLLGMLFAFVLANYWIADEIYSFVR
jgi:hypothetical protein